MATRGLALLMQDQDSSFGGGDRNKKKQDLLSDKGSLIGIILR